MCRASCRPCFSASIHGRPTPQRVPNEHEAPGNAGFVVDERVCGGGEEGRAGEDGGGSEGGGEEGRRGGDGYRGCGHAGEGHRQEGEVEVTVSAGWRC